RNREINKSNPRDYGEEKQHRGWTRYRNVESLRRSRRNDRERRGDHRSRVASVAGVTQGGGNQYRGDRELGAQGGGRSGAHGRLGESQRLYQYFGRSYQSLQQPRHRRGEKQGSRAARLGKSHRCSQGRGDS